MAVPILAAGLVPLTFRDCRSQLQSGSSGGCLQAGSAQRLVVPIPNGTQSLCPWPRSRHAAGIPRASTSSCHRGFLTSRQAPVSRKSIPSLQGTQGSGIHLGPCAWHVLGGKIPKAGCSSSSSPSRAMGSNPPSILPTPGVPLPTPICFIARNSWKRPKITLTVP